MLLNYLILCLFLSNASDSLRPESATADLLSAADSVQNVMGLLDVFQIEQLKQKVIQVLIQRKTFHSSRYRGHWFGITVDASGMGRYDHQLDEQCLQRTSKNGTTNHLTD